MKYASKIKLTVDDFVLVGMNYNYFMIPRLACPKENLQKLKQQILDDQKMTSELRTILDDDVQDKSLEKISQIMEKYFGKRADSNKSSTTRDAEFGMSPSSEDTNQIQERIRNGDGAETQNNLVNGVVLVSTCTDCGIKFVPKNSMTYETLCGFCIGKKQNVTEMDV